jgi:hypothetical protein
MKIIENTKPNSFYIWSLIFQVMKEIKLLQDQIEKLNRKEFDLDAWKQYTVVLLARIFGEHDPKIKQIEKIEYDFSSWSLRDTSGKSAYMETCKKLGREVLEASVDELKAFGLPDKQAKPEKSIPVESLIHALEEELKISQYRELVRLIVSESDQDEKIKKLKELIGKFEKSFSENVLLSFLADEKVQDAFDN